MISKISSTGTGFTTPSTAHFDGIIPRANLIFVDYAAFLQKAWSTIGIYLNVVTA